jgi:hypothetical protein
MLLWPHLIKTLWSASTHTHTHILALFDKLVVKSYMNGNCHVWFGGWRNQLSTPTFDYCMVLSDLNVGNFIYLLYLPQVFMGSLRQVGLIILNMFF